MAALRADPPGTLLGRPATVDEPDAGILRVRADGARVVVRPSGTEPKLKAYLEVVGDPAGLDALKAELAPRLQRTAPN
jgi:phosphomannomutase